MADFDESLIRLLQEDGRAQFSSLADGLGVHRTVVAQRVHELLSSGEIRIVAAVHPHVLGFPVRAHLMLRISGSTTDALQRVLAHENVVYLSETTGSFHAAVEIWTSSRDELARSIALIRQIDGVHEIEVSLYDSVLRTLLLSPETELADRRLTALDLDAFDVELMAHLQEDGRLTFGELARRTGRSASACRSRVMRLLDERVMRIGAVRRRGGTTNAVLWGIGILPNPDPASLTRLEEHITNLPGVEFVARTIGRYPIIATIAASSLADYTDTVRAVRARPEVHLADTWIHASVWAERYEWSFARLSRRGQVDAV